MKTSKAFLFHGDDVGVDIVSIASPAVMFIRARVGCKVDNRLDMRELNLIVSSPTRAALRRAYFPRTGSFGRGGDGSVASSRNRAESWMKRRQYVQYLRSYFAVRVEGPRPGRPGEE